MNRPVIVRTIPVTAHGRYLVQEAAHPGAVLLLVGFHGYKENAEIAMERLGSIPGSDRWTLVSVQGLHRFYRSRSEQVIASWMTREDRELAIDDNAAYVAAVVEAVFGASGSIGALVFSGFSQGVAMAFRAACRSARPVSGVIALGGDVPPELGREDLSRAQSVLLGRGERDEWYTTAKHEADRVRLAAAGVSVKASVLDAGHEWTPAFGDEAGEFLETLRR